MWQTKFWEQSNTRLIAGLFNRRLNQTRSGNHPSVANTRSNLAGVLQDLGDLEGAKELLEQAMASALAQFGEDHPSVATRRLSLAAVLYAGGALGEARGSRQWCLNEVDAFLG